VESADGLPDSFKGVKSADELVGKMLPAYVDLDKRFTGARETIAKLPAAAKTADEYKFAPTDKTKAYFPRQGRQDRRPVLADRARGGA
jgi:hypothetical protein